MTRNLTVATLSVVLAVLAWSPTQAVPPAGSPAHHHVHGSDCSDACARCANACNSCFEHCVAQLAAGHEMHSATLRLCNDCGDLCSLAARVESRQGPMRVAICGTCADSCDRCAGECEKFTDQPHMVACAKACRECAQACRAMIEHVGHAG